MKKILSLILLLFVVKGTFGQVQQGIVKTRGRITVDGLYKPGSLISDAVISIDNRNKYISNSKGEFVFAVSEHGSYRISQVAKKGYLLTDQDLLFRDKVFSESPIFILLESEDEWMNYRRSVERIIRTNYQNKIYERQEELDKLRFENKVSKEKLKQMQIEIDEAWDLADKYIKDMSLRFLKLDYDYEDNFYQQIGTLILNGSLERADSLLSTKGDIEERINKGLNYKNAICRYNEETIKICDYKCDIHAQQNNKDSIAFYLELKASLDKENIEWQIQAAQHRAFVLNDHNGGLNIIEDALNTCNFNNMLRYNLPMLYCVQGDIYLDECKYKDAMLLYESAMINYLKQNNETEHLNLFVNKGYVPGPKWSKTRPELIPIYIGMANCLAKLSVHLKGYNNKYKGIYGTNYAFDLYCFAMIISKNIYGERSIKTAEAYYEFAAWLCYIESRTHAKRVCKQIIDILSGIENDEYLLASTYLLLGDIYSYLGKFKDALRYTQKSLEIYMVNKNNPKYNDFYRIEEQLGQIYFQKREYSRAIDYYKASIETKSKKYGENSIQLARLYNNLGYVYYNSGHKEEALIYLTKSYDLRMLYLGEDNLDTKITKGNIEYVTKHIKN